MSAYGYKQTSRGQLANVCFTPNSGHSEAQVRLGLKKRTLDVRFAPNSGRSTGCRGMSAYDPKRTFEVRAFDSIFMVLCRPDRVFEWAACCTPCTLIRR